MTEPKRFYAKNFGVKSILFRLLYFTQDLTSVSEVRSQHLMHPFLLEDYVPIQALGDGNCMQKRASRALYRHEQYHELKRLLCSLDIVEHREHYDVNTSNYVDQINDDRVLCMNYEDLIESTCTIHSYSGMLQICAFSAVLGFTIRSLTACQTISNGTSPL